MSEWSFVVAAYAVTWIGIVGYGVYLGRRLSRTAVRLRDAVGANGAERR